MKVKAKQLGFYGKKRVYEGEIFDIDEKHFSKRWMSKDIEPASAPTAKPAKSSDKDKQVI
jgi:hypothetical protein